VNFVAAEFAGTEQSPQDETATVLAVVDKLLKGEPKGRPSDNVQKLADKYGASKSIMERALRLLAIVKPDTWAQKRPREKRPSRESA
jgi:hypothetical protein